MKLVVTIPAYNEERTIAKVIGEIPRSIPGIDSVEVLVINDGSSDATVARATEAGADHVVSFKRNMGLATAFRAGLETALALGADIIVNTDADFQYDQAQIPDLVKPILEGKADLVLGSRFAGRIESMPISKRVANKFVSFIVRRFSGLPISDAQTGFRAFARDAAMQLHITAPYTYVQETIMQAARRRLVVREIPITFRKRADKSRLIGSLRKYAFNAGPVMVRTYVDYHPAKVFLPLAAAPTLAGTLLAIVSYAASGQVSPHVPVVSGLIASGFLAAVAGILAGMLGTQRRFQEECLYRLKKLQYDSGREQAKVPGNR